MTSAPTPYVLIDTALEGLRGQLPSGLTHSERQPADPPDLVEVWFVG